MEELLLLEKGGQLPPHQSAGVAGVCRDAASGAALMQHLRGEVGGHTEPQVQQHAAAAAQHACPNPNHPWQQWEAAALRAQHAQQQQQQQQQAMMAGASASGAATLMRGSQQPPC